MHARSILHGSWHTRTCSLQLFLHKQVEGHLWIRMYTYIYPQSKVQGWAKVLACRTKPGPHLTPIKALALQTPYALQDPETRRTDKDREPPPWGRHFPISPVMPEKSAKAVSPRLGRPCPYAHVQPRDHYRTC